MLILIALASSGCSYFTNQMSPERFEHGYAIILPGIEGKSFSNSNLAQGLKDSGYPGVIEVDNWTTGSFLFFPTHLRDLERNRREAARIAEKIVLYQNQYPGRPVHLIGHSGGGGMALLAIEALPPGYQVTTATLLQVAVSPEYDLTPSLAKTEVGIWNYHSPFDVILLGAGTSLLGTFDGRRGPAAGLIGFRDPNTTSVARQSGVSDLYEGKLHDVPYNWRMLATGNLGGHVGSTWIAFSHMHLAPILAEAETHRDATQMSSAKVPASIPVRVPAMPAQPGWLNAVHRADSVDEHDSNSHVQPASSAARAREHSPSAAPTFPDQTD